MPNVPDYLANRRQSQQAQGRMTMPSVPRGQRTIVQLPFTERTPSMTSRSGQALTDCRDILDRLSPHERDVALANLLAHYAR